MSDEIEDIKKRLTALEKQDLRIARAVSEIVCTTRYNTSLPLLKGDEYESFKDIWLKRIDEAREKIRASQTVKGAFDVMYQFDSELVDYMAATKVNTADKAMEIAHSFIKKYSPVALPLKAERENDIWLVDIDVGALAVKIAKVKVDAKTGDILSYDIPQK